MRIKNIITAFLMMIIVLQALPVKHAVRYFSDDNYTAEETLPTNSETKNCKCFDDDHNLVNDFHQASAHLIFIADKFYFQFTESLPALHTADIQTPPPNLV